MAADAIGEDFEDGGEGPKKKKFSGKKLILFIVLPLLLLIGAGVGVYLSGMLSPAKPTVASTDSEAPPPPPPAQAVFFDLPEIIVNLNSAGRRSTFLKMNVSLELQNPADIGRINEVMPRIIDNFQVYLRELRIEDLQGSAGMYRLREELLRRVNLAVRPARVRDVLFREMLVQ
ncbi:MAG: flagellar basal body-associated FliL family protein [Alphaproteobacteria bacterium]|nr:flagellar basal body-associated FliL family protein [Alphaproteobacteria bacterium]MBU0797024.1 flagellar basal body-associated FliL family protein [Alphaproteobacteria bacterium]MBU0886570.1 flagellar basal body-associated FliL family protein [Alphaproteobacteria bacterium]MBU1814158.1 flagellar basal body-associated FliL family protein [Alphaproteobacteria bacterium]MBU2089828.1 flagellar basal body-associated FliL family protein [Alphaproteobacteria bacterium]